MKKIILIITTTLLFNCKFATTQGSAGTDLDQLQNQMAGFYSSEAHSVRDKSYYNIALRMTPIWKNKGNYLFVEQAMFEQQDKPYRVRVYRLSKNENGQFVSEIYTIKNEKNWIGKHETPEIYDNLQLTDIELKNGCEVVLDKISQNVFKDKTGDKKCPSELRGAKFANSIVDIYSDKIVSWDQGFDATGKQVWGAEKGGYEFVKMK